MSTMSGNWQYIYKSRSILFLLCDLWITNIIKIIKIKRMIKVEQKKEQAVSTLLELNIQRAVLQNELKLIRYDGDVSCVIDDYLINRLEELDEKIAELS